MRTRRQAGERSAARSESAEPLGGGERTRPGPSYNQPDFLNCRYSTTHTTVIVASASG